MERRKFARIEINMMLKFKSLESFEDHLDGSACDLSEGGICIMTPRAKPVGSKVEIELPVPGSHPVIIKGTVRSVRQNSGQPFAMGIEFENLADPALGIIRYLVDKSKENSRGQGSSN